MFRSCRLKQRVQAISKALDIDFEKDDVAWHGVSQSGKRCVLLDFVTRRYHHTLTVADRVMEVVTRGVERGHEQFCILLCDLDDARCLRRMPDECYDNAPHISLHNFVDHLDVDSVRMEIMNRTIHMRTPSLYYGLCKYRFNCYGHQHAQYPCDEPRHTFGPNTDLFCTTTDVLWNLWWASMWLD